MLVHLGLTALGDKFLKKRPMALENSDYDFRIRSFFSGSQADHQIGLSKGLWADNEALNHRKAMDDSA